MDNSGIYAQIFLFSQKVYLGIFQHSNMRRKKTKKNFSHQHFWKVVGIVEDKCSSFSFQRKFGSTTAKFFDFMFQVTILDLVFATMILGLVFVPQVTLPENIYILSQFTNMQAISISRMSRKINLKSLAPTLYDLIFHG